MSKTPIRYRCETPTCPLGTPGNPGHFTGGITAEQALMITGDPDATHGEGVCPNCGQPGTHEKEG